MYIIKNNLKRAINDGAQFLFYCAAMGYHFNFLPLLDDETARSLPELHRSFPEFFNSTRTRSSTCVVVPWALSVREMEATALLSAVGRLRTGFIWEDLMM